MTMGAGEEIGRFLGFWSRLSTNPWMIIVPIRPMAGGFIGRASPYMGVIGGRDNIWSLMESRLSRDI